MLEFDIEIAKIAIANESGKIVTRNGNDVIIFKWDDPDPNSFYPIQGRILLGDLGPDNPLALGTWTKEGKFLGKDRESEHDLFIEELC